MWLPRRSKLIKLYIYKCTNNACKVGLVWLIITLPPQVRGSWYGSQILCYVLGLFIIIETEASSLSQIGLTRVGGVTYTVDSGKIESQSPLINHSLPIGLLGEKSPEFR